MVVIIKLQLDLFPLIYFYDWKRRKVQRNRVLESLISQRQPTLPNLLDDNEPQVKDPRSLTTCLPCHAIGCPSFQPHAAWVIEWISSGPLQTLFIFYPHFFSAIIVGQRNFRPNFNMGFFTFFVFFNSFKIELEVLLITY